MNNIQEKLFLILALIFAAILYFLQQPDKSTDPIWKDALPSFHKDSLQKIVISTQNTSFTLEKYGTSWNVVSPISYPANLDTIERVLTIFSQVQCQADLKSDLKEYGLDAPVITFQMFGSEESRFLIGDETPTEQADYIRANERSCRTKTKISERIPITLQDYLDASLLHVSISEIETIELAGGMMEKTDLDWFLRTPFSVALSNSKMEQWLNVFIDEEAESFYDSPKLHKTTDELIIKTADTNIHIAWNESGFAQITKYSYGIQVRPKLLRALSLVPEVFYENMLLPSTFQRKIVTHAEISDNTNKAIIIDEKEVFWTLIKEPVFVRKAIPFGSHESKKLFLYFDDDTKLEYTFFTTDQGIVLQYPIEDIAILAPLDFLPLLGEKP